MGASTREEQVPASDVSHGASDGCAAAACGTEPPAPSPASPKARRNLFKESLILTYTKFVNICATLAYGMIIVRALSKQEFGQYTQVFVVINLAVVIFGLAFPNSINYFLPKQATREGKARYLSQIVVISNLMGVLAGLGIIIFHQQLAAMVKGDVAGLLVLAAVLPLCRMASALYDNTLIVYNQTVQIAIRRTIISVIQVANACVIWIGGFGITGLLATVVATEVLIGVYVLWSIYKEAGASPFRRMDTGIVRAIFAFTLPLAGASIIGTLNTEVNKIFISRLFGAEKLAEYAVVSRELPLIIIATSVTAVFMPQISRALGEKDYTRAVTLWKNSVVMNYLTSAWMIGILFVCADDIIRVLYTDNYLPGIWVFRIFALVLLFRLTHWGMILNVSGHSKAILQSVVLVFAANIALFFMLVPFIGYLAAAISILLSIMFMAIQMVWKTTKVVGVPARDIIPWHRLATILLFNAALGAVIMLARPSWPWINEIHPIASLLVISAVWAGVYFLVFGKSILALRHSAVVVEDQPLRTGDVK